MPGETSGLSEELQWRAREELGEDPVRRENDIVAVRQWLLSQQGLNARTDRTTILRYLRGCKFSLERTKAKMEVYYMSKGANQEFQDRDPLDPALRDIFQQGLMVPLPGYDRQGRKVTFARLGRWNPARNRAEDLFKAASMIFDVLFLDDEQTTITGIVQANDMTGLTLSHVASLHLPLIRKVLKTWQDGYPLRPKGVHYINTPSAFDTLYNLFKPFMKEKMKKRIHVHGSNLAAMQQHVPKEILPEEYGGTAGTMEEISGYWMGRLDHYRAWFLEDEKYRADTGKHCPGKTTGGSFRRLNLD